MVCPMDGSGNMALTLFRVTAEMEQLATLMAMGCQIYKNILTCNLKIGTALQHQVFLIRVFGGTVQFQSMIGMKKEPCSTTDLVAVIVAQTAPAV